MSRQVRKRFNCTALHCVCVCVWCRDYVSHWNTFDDDDDVDAYETIWCIVSVCMTIVRRYRLNEWFIYCDFRVIVVLFVFVKFKIMLDVVVCCSIRIAK